MIQQVVDGFAMIVDIFKFGQIFTVMEKAGTAKLQFARHATIITERGASATVDYMKCLLLVKNVGGKAH